MESQDSGPELEPVHEAGGGEAEGFEQAEQALVENASHGEHSEALDEGIPFEGEAQESGAAYGEPDEPGGTEKTADR